MTLENTSFTWLDSYVLKRGFYAAIITGSLLNCQVHADLSGKVATAGSDSYSVELYQASDKSHSDALETTKTKADGAFHFSSDLTDDHVYYVKASSTAHDHAIYLSIVDGSEQQVVINELTTIATCAVYNNFISDGIISGAAKTLQAGVENVGNLVKPSTGSYGDVLIDGANLTESNTIGKLNTLAAMMAATHGDAQKFQQWKAAGLVPSEADQVKNFPSLLTSIFKHSWHNTEEQFKLFTQFYPRNGELRSTTFVPYLEMAPGNFAMAVRFTGGGIYSPGKLEIDSDGNIWSGQNWMPGSQSNTLRGIGGGMVKLSPSGKALSPPVTGFVGPGVNGCGWGTVVGNGKVWMTSFNGKIAVFDMDGNAVAATIDGDLLSGMGCAISPVNQDVWVCDGAGNQMIVFPGGDPAKGKVIKVPNLASPFSVVIDDSNDVWVGNSAGDFVTKFNGSSPLSSEKYMTGGISIRGLCLDHNQNIWVSNSFNLDTKVPKVDPTFSIMEQFTFLGKFSYENWPPYTEKTVGALTLLDRNNPKKPVLTIQGPDSELCAPWGNVVDGDNQLWAGNFLATGVLHYATSDMPEYQLKKGDLIHRYQSGLYQLVTDVLVDYMGHVWVANNWNDVGAVLGIDNQEYRSTLGGGTGITVIYGVAEPIARK